MQGRRQVGIVCYICGREFGTRSIAIHEPQCLKKWDTQNSKRPKNKRLPKPVKPLEFDQSFSSDPVKKAEQIAQINEASNAAATANLTPCSNCGRKFVPERIETHEGVCMKLKMSPGKALKSGSGFYGQRIVVVDGEQVEVIKAKDKTFVNDNPNDQTNFINKMEQQICKNIAGGPLKMLPCPFCKRAFSHNAISIHTKNCRARHEVEEHQVTEHDRQSPPQVVTEKSVKCPFCNKGFPHKMITVHTKNCSAKPKALSSSKQSNPSQNSRPQPSPSPKQALQNGTNILKNGNDNSVSDERKKWEAPQNIEVGYQRYSSNQSLSPRQSERIRSSLNTDTLHPSTLRKEEIIDLVLGVNPNLVLTCMVCGLIVLKSQLNTHYHNYCESSNMQRSLTVPDNKSSSVKLSKVSPRSKIPQLSSRGNNTSSSQPSLQPHPPSQPSLQPHPPHTPLNEEEILECQFCGGDFGHDNIIEHEEECSKSVPKPPYSTKTIGRSSSPSSNVVGKVVTGKYVTCINCGKAFTVRSLVIHQKQCLK